VNYSCRASCIEETQDKTYKQAIEKRKRKTILTYLARLTQSKKNKIIKNC